MKARDLYVGAEIVFEFPDDIGTEELGRVSGKRFTVEYVNTFCKNPYVDLIGDGGALRASDDGLLRYARLIGEQADVEQLSEKELAVPRVTGAVGYGQEEECQTAETSATADADGEDEEYFRAKADMGKPAARLIPLHALVPEEDEQLKELGRCIFHEEYYDAMVVLDDVISEIYDGEDVLSFAQRALDYGLEKYGEEGSWADVPNGRLRYRDAAARHFIAYVWRGKDEDEESGLNHLAHLAANLLFLGSGELE